MAHLKLISAPREGIAESHQNTVAAIVHAAKKGLFTTAEAQVIIDRLRMLTSKSV